MKYRRNSDADIRELEREYQATGNFDAFLQYRRALARTGHQEVLTYHRGMFLVSVSSGNIEYIKTLGPTYANLVQSWELTADLTLEELNKKKGMRTAFDSPTLRSWHILFPRELFSHIKTLVFNYYQDQKDKLKIRFPDHREDGMLFYAMTQWPSYQEGLYKLVVGELESLGYYQSLPLPEVFCSSGCGRSMGLNTPARGYKKECFYCWRKSMNFKQEWLDEQLTYHGSHAPQLRRNPDEEIRNLEREVQTGDTEACIKLIRIYERISGSKNFNHLIEEYMIHLMMELPYDLRPQNCDTNPIVAVEVISKYRDLVQKYGPQRGRYGDLTNCCEHNTWYEGLEDAQTAANKINQSLNNPLQQIYLRWRAYPNRYSRIQPSDNLSWDNSANPYSIELLAAIIMVGGPNIEEMRNFLLPTES